MDEFDNNENEDDGSCEIVMKVKWYWKLWWRSDDDDGIDDKGDNESSHESNFFESSINILIESSLFSNLFVFKLT